MVIDEAMKCCRMALNQDQEIVQICNHGNHAGTTSSVRLDRSNNGMAQLGSRTQRIQQLRRAARGAAAPQKARRSQSRSPSTSSLIGETAGQGVWASRINHTATAATALAAIAALLFTGISSRQARDELKNRQRELDISEQGQVTERYTAAVEQLGNSSLDVRLGGIYALERIMRDSPRDQPTITSVLSSYMHTHCVRSKQLEETTTPEDLKAAASVIANRKKGVGDESQVNWSRCSIVDASMKNAFLAEADLSRSHLSAVTLSGDMRGINLEGASLHDVNMEHVNFQNAWMVDVHLSGDCYISNWDLTGAQLDGFKVDRVANGTVFQSMNFSNTSLKNASLVNLSLPFVSFRNADLEAANLSGLSVSASSLALRGKPADFRGASLAGARLDGADLSEAIGLTKEQIRLAHFTTATQLPPALSSDPVVMSWARQKP
ncbi:pentapeptide repeat-containing protein [Streptomyces justiciae]|uniref:pentapeptide repeat-containing protein n=1 Tax=Streptomyces justiciae TaxID=2780140 RepID=UPI00187EC822|nr:pentapeptide repeat-containing protein [Streptomyces justiciae]MBE8477484.1 pentapeptide repeat-containing protein [Streptomyces justiciae]